MSALPIDARRLSGVVTGILFVSKLPGVREPSPSKTIGILFVSEYSVLLDFLRKLFIPHWFIIHIALVDTGQSLAYGWYSFQKIFVSSGGKQGGSQSTPGASREWWQASSSCPSSRGCVHLHCRKRTQYCSFPSIIFVVSFHADCSHHTGLSFLSHWFMLVKFQHLGVVPFSEDIGCCWRQTNCKSQWYIGLRVPRARGD